MNQTPACWVIKHYQVKLMFCFNLDHKPQMKCQTSPHISNCHATCLKRRQNIQTFDNRLLRAPQFVSKFEWKFQQSLKNKLLSFKTLLTNRRLDTEQDWIGQLSDLCTDEWEFTFIVGTITSLTIWFQQSYLQDFGKQNFHPCNCMNATALHCTQLPNGFWNLERRKGFQSWSMTIAFIIVETNIKVSIILYFYHHVVLYCLGWFGCFHLRTLNVIL